MKLPELNIAHMKAKFPIMQGGMGVGISLSKLASAVSNAGGIGTISGTGIPITEMIAHIRKARAMAHEKSYIGVNVLFSMTQFAETMKAAMEEKVDFIISGAGISRDMYSWGKSYGIPVISIVSSAKLAKISERLGAAAVVVEGVEAGGHLGTDRPLFEILPEVVQAVSIPVIAAGGILDGKDLHKALQTGASGVQMGTRFAASKECDAPLSFKDKIIAATKTEFIQSVVGLEGRAIRNAFTEKIKDNQKVKIDKCYKCLKNCSHQYCILDALLKTTSGDAENGLVFSGARVAEIKEIMSVKEIFEKISREYLHIGNTSEA